MLSSLFLFYSWGIFNKILQSTISELSVTPCVKTYDYGHFLNVENIAFEKEIRKLSNLNLHIREN